MAQETRHDTFDEPCNEERREVYANLSGDMKHQAECIVQAMQQTGVKRLVFISSMGISKRGAG